MNSQQLDTRIQIDALTVTKGASGGQVKSWQLRAELWARRMDLSGNEQRLTRGAGGEAATARVEFTIRARDGLDATTLRVRHKGKVFDIEHVKPLVTDRGWMVLTCSTGANNG